MVPILFHSSLLARASKIIIIYFYADDLLAGAISKEKLVNIRNEVKKVLLQRGFELRKWSPNNREILKDILNDLKIQFYI